MNKVAHQADASSVAADIQEKSRFSHHVRHLLWWTFGITVTLIGVHLILQYLNLEIFAEKNGQIYEMSNRFDFDDESSFPTWFSQAVFLLIGVGSFLVAYLTADKLKRRLWWIIGVIAVVISIDEVASFHEYILQALHVAFFGDSATQLFANAWWAVLPFIFIVAVTLIYLLVKSFPPRTIWILTIGGLIFLIGAVGVDLMVVTIDKTSFLSQGIMVAIEESLELIGGLFVMYAIIDYLRIYHIDKLSNAFKELKKS